MHQERKQNPTRFCRRDFLKLGVAGLLTGCCRPWQRTVAPPDTAPTPTQFPVPTFTIPPAAPPEATMALVNGVLIDGTGADQVPDAVVLINQKRIVGVGSRDQVGVSADVQIIDVGGATILPGFINAHVHASYDRSTLEAWAQGGVTTVRDMGDGRPYAELFAFRDGARDEARCARLVAVGPIVTVPGGYPIAPWGGSGLTVASPEDARHKVEGLLDAGADLIKIALESGDIFGQEIPTLSPAETSVIVQVAHEWDTVVTAHVTVSQNLEKALDAGVDDVAHMVTDPVPDALIDRMIEADVCWVPTLELWESVGKDYAVDFDAQAIANLGRFAAAGGKVALGTDYGGYSAEFGLGMPIREIELMRQAGMTPLQIIVAATKNAARVCNLAHEIGTLEVGKVADVLVVDGDPLQDVHALTGAQLVLRDGVVIRG